MNRTQAIERLKNEPFDICIIGAGASGAGCALDAVLRGYKVALIDRNDFASETSSKSTKLIHGGVRYLEQAFKNLDFAQLKQVKHGLEERHIVLRNAPHLARPLPLITPVSSWVEGLYFSIGLKMYDQFATNDTLPKSKWLNKDQVLAKIPALNRRKLHSGVLYYDGQLDDARYCLALAQSASEAGAAVANYLDVKGFGTDKNGKISSVKVQDVLTSGYFSVSAKLVINCTGPFSDQIRLLANASVTPRLRPSKGVHIMLPHASLKSEYAMLIPKTSDDRVVFAIPFEGALMVGTTDTDAGGDLTEPALNASEKQYLLATINPYLENEISEHEVKSGFGGLRPLIAAGPSKSTKKLVRDHEVEWDEQSGLLSLLGGKWTTYRLMAKDTIDEADKLLSRQNECKTADHVLAGGENYTDDSWSALVSRFGIDEDIARHLVRKYGSRAEKVMALTLPDGRLSQRLAPGFPFIQAEVVFAVRYEMAVTLRDFLARRIRLEIVDWAQTMECLPVVARLMAAELGWDEPKMRFEVAAYQALLEQFASGSN